MPPVAVYRLAEVAEHNKSHGDDRSVWTVIHDKVYDITHLLLEHPGGEEVLIENAAGVDSTESYEDTWPSSDNREMLKDFYIGELHEEDQTGRMVEQKHFNLRGTQESEPTDDTSFAFYLLPSIVLVLASIPTILFFLQNDLDSNSK